MTPSRVPDERTCRRSARSRTRIPAVTPRSRSTEGRGEIGVRSVVATARSTAYAATARRIRPGSVAHPSRSPGSSRLPRAQSPAGMAAFFSSACTSPTATPRSAVPTSTSARATAVSPGVSSSTSVSPVSDSALPSQLESLPAMGRPCARIGRAAADQPIDSHRRKGPVDPRVVGEHLGREARHRRTAAAPGTSSPASMPSRVASSSCAPATRAAAARRRPYHAVRPSRSARRRPAPCPCQFRAGTSSLR